MAIRYRKGMKAKIKRNIEDILKKCPPERYPHVIDVGTKEGYAVDWFTKFGYKAIGIEAEKGYERHGVMVADYFKLNITPKSYDIVFSRHSLEHIALENENGTIKFLKKSRDILRAGGILYIIVPIVQWAEFEFKTKDDVTVSDAFHALTGMMEDTGFYVQKKRMRENALIIGRKK